MLHSICRSYRMYFSGHRTIVIRGRDIGVGVLPEPDGRAGAGGSTPLGAETAQPEFRDACRPGVDTFVVGGLNAAQGEVEP